MPTELEKAEIVGELRMMFDKFVNTFTVEQQTDKKPDNNLLDFKAELMGIVNQQVSEEIADFKERLNHRMEKIFLEFVPSPSPDPTRCWYVNLSGIRCPHDACYKTKDGKFMCDRHSYSEKVAREPI